MKKIWIVLLMASCTKQKIECRHMVSIQENTYTHKMDTTLNAVLCGHQLDFLKPNGYKEPFVINDSTYYLITHLYGF